MKTKLFFVSGLAAVAVFLSLYSTRSQAFDAPGEFCVLEVQKFTSVVKTFISCDGRMTESVDALEDKKAANPEKVSEARDFLRNLSYHIKKLEDGGMELLNCEIYHAANKVEDTLPKTALLVPTNGKFPTEKEEFFPQFQRCIFRAK